MDKDVWAMAGYCHFIVAGAAVALGLFHGHIEVFLVALTEGFGIFAFISLLLLVATWCRPLPRYRGSAQRAPLLKPGLETGCATTYIIAYALSKLVTPWLLVPAFALTTMMIIIAMRRAELQDDSFPQP